jgi:hypothetical protein
MLNNYYAGQNPQGMRNGVPAGGQGGSHALQDYQMQLMLLEQQNKKRLLMARQEQDNLTSRTDQPGVGLQGANFPNVSPAHRPGQSPNPADQMKRGTPKMTPGSPLPDGSMPQQRNSPTPMGGFNGQMPDNMGPQFFHPGSMTNGAMMRPPSSHPQFNNPQMMPQVQQGGRGQPNPQWQGGPQAGQPAQMQPPQNQQPQQMPTPQQRNQEMPPPQVPPTGGANGGRAQPGSPQQAAPPTPQPANKPNPKKGKGGDAKEPRKRPQKKGSTAQPNAAATPSSEPEPPTPTPSTPITPVHPNSFANQQKMQQGQAGTNGQPQAVPGPMPAAQVVPDPSQGAATFQMDAGDPSQFNMDFGSLDTGDVLEQFDFDSFLNTDDNGASGFNFDPTSLSFGGDGGVEAGTGDV